MRCATSFFFFGKKRIVSIGMAIRIRTTPHKEVFDRLLSYMNLPVNEWLQNGPESPLSLFTCICSAFYYYYYYFPLCIHAIRIFHVPFHCITWLPLEPVSDRTLFACKYNKIVSWFCFRRVHGKRKCWSNKVTICGKPTRPCLLTLASSLKLGNPVWHTRARANTMPKSKNVVIYVQWFLNTDT